MTTCHTVIDWAATGTMLQGIGTLLGAATVLIAALIGANTFNGWKQQKIAERKGALAEKLMTATYNVRRRLSIVRSPLMLSNELDAARKKLEDDGNWNNASDEAGQKGLITLQAYYNRLNESRPEQDELRSCQPMARAFFGDDVEQAIEQLNQQFWSVKVYADANHRDRTGADADFRNKIDSTLYEGIPSKEKNEVDQIVAQSVHTIEAVCAPALRLEKAKKAPAGV